jgi:hypothetical protein
MNELVLTASIFTINFAPWLLTSRRLYRRWRSGSAYALKFQEQYKSGNVVLVEWKDGFVVTLAMLTAVLWPFVLATALVTASQPPTQDELDKREDQENQLVKREALELENAAERRRQALEKAEDSLAAATKDMHAVLGSHNASSSAAIGRLQR